MKRIINEEKIQNEKRKYKKIMLFGILLILVSLILFKEISFLIGGIGLVIVGISLLLLVNLDKTKTN